MSRQQITVSVGVGLAVLAAAWLISSGAVSAAPSGKSGGRGSVALELVAVEQPGKPGLLWAERYAQRVESLSHGSVQVTVTSWPATLARTTPTGEVDASAIRAVRSSSMRLGFLPSSAFEAEGVTSLRALQAPFVFESISEVARAVSGPPGERLLAGLDGASLNGIALVPAGMVRGFGFLKSLAEPADYAGSTIRADTSKTTRRLLRLLGAQPVDYTAEAETVLAAGFVDDAEVPRGADDEFPVNAYTASNVPVFPRVEVVVASDATFDRLTPRERSILREAAEDLAAESAVEGERAAAAAFCAAGGTLELAPASAKAKLRRKVAPLVTALRRDPAARDLPARAADRAAAVVPSCSSESGPLRVQEDNVPYAQAIRLAPPRASFRRPFTRAELIRAGAGPAEAQRYEGVAMITFYGIARETSRRFVLEWPHSESAPCRGRTNFANRRVVLDWNPQAQCSGFFAFSWRVSASGDLVVQSADARSEAPWRGFLGTWKRVDCAPWCGSREKLSAGETAELVRAILGGDAWLVCQPARGGMWDYTCKTAPGWDGQNHPPDDTFVSVSVEVDDRRITRTSRP